MKRREVDVGQTTDRIRALRLAARAHRRASATLSNYATCFEFKVQARGVRGSGAAHFDMSLTWAGRVREAASSEPPPDILRLAIECSDGTTASTLGMPHLLALAADDPPPERVIWGGGGMSTGNRSEQDYVVWPLPPVGPLVFVLEWPANDIPITRVQIDGTAILRAGKDAAGESPAFS